MRTVIERHHYFRLKTAYATAAGRREVAARMREVLPGLPGVRSVTVGLPADEESEAAWDVALTLRFDSLTAIQTYRADPEHRRFVDEFLAPRIEVKKIWNFTPTDESPPIG